MEQGKKELLIDDYSISQTSLEQVTFRGGQRGGKKTADYLNYCYVVYPFRIDYVLTDRIFRCFWALLGIVNSR